MPPNIRRRGVAVNQQHDRARLVAEFLVMQSYSVDIDEPRPVGMRNEMPNVLKTHGVRARQNLDRDRGARGAAQHQRDIPLSHRRDSLYQNDFWTNRLVPRVVSTNSEKRTCRIEHPHRFFF